MTRHRGDRPRIQVGDSPRNYGVAYQGQQGDVGQSVRNWYCMVVEVSLFVNCGTEDPYQVALYFSAGGSRNLRVLRFY